MSQGRVSKLEQVFEKAVSKSLEHLDEQKFLQSFPTFQQAPLSRLRMLLLENIKKAMEQEFEVIVKERKVREKLSKLDELSVDEGLLTDFLQENGCPEPSHMTPAHAILVRKLRVKNTELDKLNQYLSELEEENRQLRNSINEQQKQKQKITAKITSTTNQLDELYRMSSEWKKESLPQVQELLDVKLNYLK